MLQYRFSFLFRHSNLGIPGVWAFHIGSTSPLDNVRPATIGGDVSKARPSAPLGQSFSHAVALEDDYTQDTLDDYDESDAYQMKIYYADALALIYEGKKEEARELLQDKDSWVSVIKADDLDGQSIIDYATSQHSDDDSISYVYDKVNNPKLSYSWHTFTKKTNPYDYYSSEKTYFSSIFTEYIYDDVGNCTEIIVISRTKYQFG